MQTLLITLLTLSTGVLSYALVNLLKKYEKLEQEIENLEETFLQTYLRMKEIDTMGRIKTTLQLIRKTLLLSIINVITQFKEKKFIEITFSIVFTNLQKTY